MSNPLLRGVSFDERLRFLRDGVVCLRGIVSPEWIELARDGIEQRRDGLLQRVVSESGASEIAGQLTVTRRLRWICDQLLFDKDVSAATATPWHQDMSCGLADSHRIVHLWMPVDHMPRETAPEVVRGSHLWKTGYRIAGQSGEAPAIELPDIESNRGAFDIVGYEVDPGDVVAFNHRALHHAGPVMSFGEKHRAFAILCADDELLALGQLNRQLAAPEAFRAAS
ncbi:phytanoyl-CoA dioxygenase family protein [Variovorax guangxiensis]|uniref:Ectoine hydroxylase-related dioxygenase (Phytanoyl-CoA dioxygenase family) n=1 Tax=Variovorax guangxiensis TaxID=1775474 RepID=A0A840FT59_9BURK|nr:phytanoyl-CoA dioxygenase family protein [Variovorax guangxiensis]MBB4223335.1 ectoine hydroxylase-related dioxygenase (phytanoyl-CoA dioxygenase family) [Variovorax guangxiensis]